VTRRDAKKLLGLALVVAVLMIVTIAAARPGGGGNYSSPSPRSSGGGGGGGGGGSGDGGAILELLVWLCFEHPVIGIPLTIAFLIYVFWKMTRRFSDKDWSAGVPDTPSSYAPRAFPEYTPPPQRKAGTSLDVIRNLDPTFSRVIFEDFLYSLYAEVHLARGKNMLNKLSAYLAPNTMTQLQQMTRGAVETVVIGAMRFLEVSASPATGARVVVELESNYTEAGRGQYVRERWTLARRPSAKSRTPERVRHLGCPNCGAPQDAVFSGSCKNCSRVVNDGSFDWTVQGVSEMEREGISPVLTSNVEERGTNSPTIRDTGLPAALSRIRTKDPAFDVAQFNARVGLIFQQFQIGWSGRDLTKMRPFMSDALFTTQQYWIQAYLAQHLRNMTDGARVTNIELAKAVTDAYYDAITVRLHATSADYTISDDGRVVSGNKSRQRAYTEYWTLIRGTNRKGPTRTDLACSNCGAPLEVNMVGTCKYCNVKVTTGDFDWVLSRIEQDESYTG
jgi:predicted lipid-binding transport protein (Tim44 family)